jgi:hypothetical protein
MSRSTPNLIPILLAGCLAACAAHQPDFANKRAVSQPAPTHRKPVQRAMFSPLPPPQSDRRTVEDVLQEFGPYAVDQLKPHFAKAGVAYPPREITLVGLKAERKLELWARDEGDYRLIRSYHILAASGTAGPKLRQGDRQVPEGVYRIVGLNPNSNFHLSMKLDYPNGFDQFHAALEGRDHPGSDIFIHGKADSIGCLAMGDDAIDELFVLVAQAGMENAKVVIAPHDPRLRPLDPYADGLPDWADELYGTIAREIQALNQPVTIARTSPFIQPRPRDRR